MPLGDEYDLAPLGREHTVRDAYTEAVDATAMERVEAEAAFLQEQYERWPTIPRYQATPENRYRNARALTADIDYSPEALYRFASTADLTRQMSGLFISGAVDILDADQVHLPAMPETDYTGYRNDTHVVVEGGVGDKAGYGMQGGTLTVKGDVGTHCGRFMEDGTITVTGDAGRALGHGMRDGHIHVHGDAADHAGIQQKGGTISVDGATGRPPFQDAEAPAERAAD